MRKRNAKKTSWAGFRATLILLAALRASSLQAGQDSIECDGLNDSVDAFAALNGAPCPLSDAAPFVTQKCATTATTVTGFSQAFKTAVSTTSSTLSDLGGQISDATIGVGQAASYQACLGFTHQAVSSMSGNLTSIGGPITGIQTALAGHRHNVAVAQNLLTNLQARATPQCQTALSLEASAAPQSVALGKTLSAATASSCAVVAPRPHPGTECQLVCPQVVADLNEVLAEQEKMIRLLEAAHTDAVAKQSGIGACQRVADSIGRNCTSALSQLLSNSHPVSQGDISDAMASQDPLVAQGRSALSGAVQGTVDQGIGSAAGRVIASESYGAVSTAVASGTRNLSSYAIGFGEGTMGLVGGAATGVVLPTTPLGGWTDDQSLGLKMISDAYNTYPSDPLLNNIFDETKNMVPGSIDSKFYENVVAQAVAQKSNLTAQLIAPAATMGITY